MNKKTQKESATAARKARKDAAAASILSEDDVEWTIYQACKFFGGKLEPLDPSTLYKGIRTGRYPPPVKPGPQTSRWIPSECREAKRRIVAEREEQFLKASLRVSAARRRKGLPADDSRLVVEVEKAIADVRKRLSQPRSLSPA